MSSPHTLTSGMDSSVHQVDEDDDDICPICEGACTCNSRTIAPIPTPCPASSSQSQNQTSSQNPAVAPLKIKLTISAALLTRTRLPIPKPPTTPTPSKRQSKDTDGAKRLGRPSKAAIRSRPHPRATSNVKDKKFTRPKSTAKDTTGNSSKSRTIGGEGDHHTQKGHGSGSAFSRSHDTDAGGPITTYNQFNLNQDFPTFVLADEFSSANESSAGSSSGSEISELTDFSDSSIVDEEESFIRTTEEQRARAHDKARVKRELLGDGLAKRKERQTDWEIRSRTKSASDNDMNVDSDETDDEAEEGAEEADDNEGEDEDEDDVGPARPSYVGIGTGWSEDEESSFDADLFFAGLGDSDSGLERPTIHGQNAAVDTDGDDSSLDNDPSSLAQGVFEITEGWDGSVIFTNGLQDGQGLLDWDFEANAAQLLTEATTTSSHGSGSEADVRMSGSDADMGDSENENDSLEEVESDDGDTTEEELIDEHGLPTVRAMRLFRPPVAQLYSINPLSTMSPGPHVQDTFSQQSPQPSDILAGHGFADEDEDVPEPPMSEIGSTVLSVSSDRGTPRFPLMGTFEASRTDSLRRAVIDGSRPAVPSPFQRRRLSGSVSARSASRTRDRSLSLSYASFTMSPIHFGLPTPSDDLTLPTSPHLPLAEPIHLDDVLDTSILDSDPVDAPATLNKPYSIIGEPETSATDDGVRHLQNLSRWDRIPMGTFRHTRDVSDGPSNLAYGDIIRSSPFNGVWPSDRGHNKPSGTPSKKGKGKRKGSLNMDISPVILPVRDRDGDHTPNGSAISQNSHNPLHSKPRKDKESRRDKMLKRKTLMGTAIGRRHQQHHHSHGHHPNSKGRASGSIQRPGVFGGGSVPPLNL